MKAYSLRPVHLLITNSTICGRYAPSSSTRYTTKDVDVTCRGCIRVMHRKRKP